MILRILTAGQFEVDEATVAALNKVDERLMEAIDENNEPAFKDALNEIHQLVTSRGEVLPDDYLGPSELLLPDVDATIEEVRELLDDEGLIPG